MKFISHYFLEYQLSVKPKPPAPIKRRSDSMVWTGPLQGESMGQKLPTLPRPAPKVVKPEKCKENYCSEQATKEHYPYCSFDCKDWDEQIKKRSKK